MTDKEYVNQIISWLAKHGDVNEVIPMQNYMKNQFSFLGIRAPKLQQLTKDFIKEFGLPADEWLDSVIHKLWDLPEREYQYIGIALLRAVDKSLPKSKIELLEYVITHKPWWDTIDVIAAYPVGGYFTRFPELLKPYVNQWLSSNHMWLQRSAIICQLKWKGRTNEEILYTAIEKCIDSKEFFIRKAIGWALREYSKTNPESVIAFVRSHEALSGLSQREALKVINRIKGHQ